MRTWSDSPFDRTVPLSKVEHYTEDAVIARDNGESSVIYEVPGFDGWLVKRYKQQTKIDQRVLSRLIELPETMSAAERILVDRGIAWPVARVVDGYRTVGTIMAKAEPKFFWDFKTLGSHTRHKVVEIDHLANTANYFSARGLPLPSTQGRLSVMSKVVACAALFERYDVVYADWSFANAFWSPRTQHTLIIDVDASGIGERRFVETPSWEDPLMRRDQPVTTHTDRYKVALLVTRAVTGQRKDIHAALAEIEQLCPDHSQLTGLLRRALNAKTVDQRPSLAELHRAIEAPTKTPTKAPTTTFLQSDGHNVTALRAWRPPTTRPRPPKPARAAPASRGSSRSPVSPAHPVRAANTSRLVSPPVAPTPPRIPNLPTAPVTPPPHTSAFLGCLIGLVLLVGAGVGIYFLITYLF
jgi:tRNA pseudouridine-54 N-methylase